MPLGHFLIKNLEGFWQIVVSYGLVNPSHAPLTTMTIMSLEDFLGLHQPHNP